MYKFNTIDEILQEWNHGEIVLLLDGYSVYDAQRMARARANHTFINLPNKPLFIDEADIPVSDYLALACGLTKDEATFITSPLNPDQDVLDRLLTAEASKVFKIILAERVKKLLNNIYWSGDIDRYSFSILKKYLTPKGKADLRKRLKLTPLYAHGRVSPEVAQRMATTYDHLPNLLPKRAKGYEAEWLMRANQGESTHRWNLLQPNLEYKEYTHYDRSGAGGLSGEEVRLLNSESEELLTDIKFHDENPDRDEDAPYWHDRMIAKYLNVDAKEMLELYPEEIDPEDRFPTPPHLFSPDIDWNKVLRYEQPQRGPGTKL